MRMEEELGIGMGKGIGIGEELGTWKGIGKGM